MLHNIHDSGIYIIPAYGSYDTMKEYDEYINMLKPNMLLHYFSYVAPDAFEHTGCPPTSETFDKFLAIEQRDFATVVGLDKGWVAPVPRSK